MIFVTKLYLDIDKDYYFDFDFYFQDAFTAFHNDIDSVKKYLKPLHIGTVKDAKNRSLDEDFRKLRSTAQQMVKKNLSV